MEDPLHLLQEWYERAVATGVVEPEAMALATSTPDGFPSVRFVLLRPKGHFGTGRNCAKLRASAPSFP